MQFYSGEGQDRFVTTLFPTSHKRWFLDLGCGHPERRSNTLALEKAGWSGLCLDINPDSKKLFEVFNRTTECIVSDLTNPDEMKRLVHYFNLREINYIDYVSFDVDDATEEVVKIFPWHILSFGVLTFEHDVLSLNSTNEKRKVLDYKLQKFPNYFKLVKDIGFGKSQVHEDWWVNLDMFNKSIKQLSADTIFWKRYINRIEKYKKMFINNYL